MKKIVLLIVLLVVCLASVATLSRHSVALAQVCENDTDNDGVTDCDDRCPFSEGNLTNAGCPSVRDARDPDEDGIGMLDDQCPTQKGTFEDKGCPEGQGPAQLPTETPPPTPTSAPTIPPTNPPAVDPNQVPRVTAPELEDTDTLEITSNVNYTPSSVAAYCGDEYGFNDATLSGLSVGTLGIQLLDRDLPIFEDASSNSAQIGAVISGDAIIPLDGPYCNDETGELWWYVLNGEETAIGWIPEIYEDDVATEFLVDFYGVYTAQTLALQPNNEGYAVETEPIQVPVGTRLTIEVLNGGNNTVGIGNADTGEELMSSDSISDYEVTIPMNIIIFSVSSEPGVLVVRYDMMNRDFVDIVTTIEILDAITQGSTQSTGSSANPPTQSTVATEPDIRLDYTVDSVSIVNISGRTLDLTNMIFASSEGIWTTEEWIPNMVSGASLENFDAGDCLQLYNFNGRQPTKPADCNDVESWVGTGNNNKFFWRDDFTVEQNGEVIAECSASTYTCELSVIE